ncbi:hypothetical protein E4T81_12135 [Barnesiella sp. WM24]|uniref:hypothetical protein n=1 Tax=Barnesiella sp. WM24 TaxID=2558278 RepID=UPI001072EA4C|nr:hypothetical protein [Barnesiella sp. WM24]TFU92332.1 hypothetical protein E4T81_12135 [Barnesiella sp. WM24]
MKKELDIYEPYVKELWDFYNEETKEAGLSFAEHCYCEFATGPEMTGALELGGFCPDNENTQEYANMNDEEQKAEVELRFKYFIKRAGEILDQQFPEQSLAEIEANAKKVLGY